jgi:hypothetical protein
VPDFCFRLKRELQRGSVEEEERAKAEEDLEQLVAERKEIEALYGRHEHDWKSKRLFCRSEIDLLCSFALAFSLLFSFLLRLMLDPSPCRPSK